MAIFVSAGHNGSKGSRNYDPGAVSKINGVQITEAELTQDFENLVLASLSKKGIKYVTDTPEESLSEYLRRIQTGSGSVVLEFHFDAAASPKATGTTVIVGSDADRLDKAFAKEILDSTTNILGTKSRGVISEGQSARGRLGLMREEGIVALLEIAFISNPQDVEKYHKNKLKLADKIADIIIHYENLL